MASLRQQYSHYPIPQTGSTTLTVRTTLRHFNTWGSYFYHFELASSTPAGTVCAFQTSTNLVNWNTLFTLTNNGSVCDYNNNYAQSRARFYRLQPQ